MDKRIIALTVCIIFATVEIIIVNRNHLTQTENFKIIFQKNFQKLSRTIQIFSRNFSESPRNVPRSLAATEKSLQKKSSFCTSMFDIGAEFEVSSEAGISFPDSVNRLVEAKKRKAQMNEDYLPLIRDLPAVIRGKKGHLRFANVSRLTALNGKLPYVPCTVRHYNMDDIVKCISVRKGRNDSFWIAFFGDSRMRNKFMYLAINTFSTFKWSFHSSDPDLQQNTVDELKENLKKFYYSSREATSGTGARLTYLCSRFGIPDPKLRQWLQATEDERVPDILVVEFGMWFYAFYQNVNLLSEDAEIHRWRNMSNLLRDSPKRMTVLVESHTRIRADPLILFKYGKGDISEEELQIRRMLLFPLRPMNSEFADIVTRHILSKNRVIFWDSTLPFNLASKNECKLLRASNMSIILEELKQPFKMFLNYMCHDSIHKTKFTMQDEFDMMFNFICNKDLVRESSSGDLCCAR